MEANLSIQEIYKDSHFNKYYLQQYNKYINSLNLVTQELNVTEHYNLELNTAYALTGRIVNKRDYGKLKFIEIYNYGTNIQLIFEKSETLNYDLTKTLTRGDVIYVKGITKYSSTQIMSLLVHNWNLISKTLMEHPDKIGKIKEKAVYKSKRYLEIIYQNNLYNNLVNRSNIFRAIRNYFIEQNYLEVDTPALSVTYGGALAKPFITELNDTKSQLYLSVAPELRLKDCIFAGFNRVYTITHNFRNEGIDKTHHPQFAALEFYAQNKDCISMIEETCKLIKAVVKNVKGNYKILFKNYLINFQNFELITYDDCLNKYYPDRSVECYTELIKKHNLEFSTDFKNMEYTIFDKLITPQLIQPTCVLEFPELSTPLAKRIRGKEYRIEQCEIYVAGIELANIYGEENNIHELCSKNIIHSIDKPHIDMLSYGQYIHGGSGIGLDRLVMLLTNENDIKNVIFFPL